MRLHPKGGCLRLAMRPVRRALAQPQRQKGLPEPCALSVGAYCCKFCSSESMTHPGQEAVDTVGKVKREVLVSSQQSHTVILGTWL